MKHLVLVGGGHAHLFVLQRLAKERRNDIVTTLISPSRWQYYSGMLPGWIAGLYEAHECRIDLRSLAQAADARFIEQAAIGLYADDKQVETSDRQRHPYDALSLDIGSETNCRDLTLLGDRLLPVRSSHFHERWQDILGQARVQPGYRLAIVGGGAAGVEVALAARTALARVQTSTHVDLVCGVNGPLRGMGAIPRRLAGRALARLGVTVHRHRATGTHAGLRLDDAETLEVNAVIATTGASAPQWLRATGASHDVSGYVRVDHHYRSVSHPSIFAAGDICASTTGQVQRSGVYAVRAGPVLAHNLLAALKGHPLTPHRPRRRALYILATGDRQAMATWGPLSGSGRWAWRLKDWIDRRFMRRFGQP